MLQDLLHWDEVIARGFDAGVYLVMALVGTSLFLIRLTMALFGGDDGGGDLDVETDVMGHSDGGFTFFSLLSVLAFFMGAGWMGLAARIDWEMSNVAAAFTSTGFGLVMMFAASSLTWATRRLNQEAHYDVASAVGATGRAYLPIPERGGGRGQVEVTVSGRRKIVQAVSEGGSIDSFTDVIVVSAQDDDTLVVRPKYSNEES